MRGGHTYRHINCLDIDVDCLKVTYVGVNYIKAKLRLFHRRNLAVYETGMFKIQRKDLKKWKIV